MANIKDFKTSKPHMVNSTWVYVWEVIRSEWDEWSDEEEQKIVAVYFDPWKAVNYGTSNFGVACMIQLSMYHYDSCREEK